MDKMLCRFYQGTYKRGQKNFPVAQTVSSIGSNIAIRTAVSADKSCMEGARPVCPRDLAD